MKEQGNQSILADNVPAFTGELRGKLFFLVMLRPFTYRTMGSRCLRSVSGISFKQLLRNWKT